MRTVPSGVQQDAIIQNVLEVTTSDVALVGFEAGLVPEFCLFYFIFEHGGLYESSRNDEISVFSHDCHIAGSSNGKFR